MRYLGLDVGRKRIGVAITDELGVAPHPYTVIKRKRDFRDVDAICEIVKNFKISKVVVGVPISYDGSLSLMAREILKFCDMLRARGIEVLTVDESLSSKEAEKILLEADLSRKRRKEVIDKIAASLILEAYLREDGKEMAS